LKSDEINASFENQKKKNLIFFLIDFKSGDLKLIYFIILFKQGIALLFFQTN